MIVAHYAHRLPAGHDMALIRNRAVQRGPLWDAVPELYFKGFLLREQGRHGAIANNYSSLYLWRQDQALCDFLVSGRYKFVTDAFGRAAIETRVALDARRGRGNEARFAYKEELDIAVDADLTAECAREIARNREIADRADTVVTALAIDPHNWRFTRILLSENAPSGSEAATCYEVLYLAQPLLDTLPCG
jgi:hypothetical protein